MPSSSSFQSARRLPLVCRCGLPFAHKQSWTKLNPGRRFIVCKLSKPCKPGVEEVTGCGEFHWTDAHMEEWQKDVINQLISEKELLETEVDMLKYRILSLESEKSAAEKKYRKLSLKVDRAVGRNKTKTNGSCIMKNCSVIAVLVVLFAVLCVFVSL